jgi:hypothetical protein
MEGSHILGRLLLAGLTGACAPAGSPARADERERPLLFHEVGVAAGFPTGAIAAGSYTPTFLLIGGRLNVGLGARLSSYFGGAGVAYPNGDPGLLEAGARNTLTVDQPHTYALNLMLAVSLRVVAGLEAGLNIDLVGVGFGLAITGTYAGADPAFAGPRSASPSRLNLLLLGRHDHGQLDSEFFVAYWFGQWGIRAGASHMSTEYTTDRPLDGGNDRFRASATRFFAATGYRF